jgi:hypothetical protein
MPTDYTDFTDKEQNGFRLKAGMTEVEKTYVASGLTRGPSAPETKLAKSLNQNSKPAIQNKVYPLLICEICEICGKFALQPIKPMEPVSAFNSAKNVNCLR